MKSFTAFLFLGVFVAGAFSLIADDWANEEWDATKEAFVNRMEQYLADKITELNKISEEAEHMDAAGQEAAKAKAFSLIEEIKRAQEEYIPLKTLSMKNKN